MNDKRVLEMIAEEVAEWDRFRNPEKDRDTLARICEILRDEGIL